MHSTTADQMLGFLASGAPAAQLYLNKIVHPIVSLLLTDQGGPYQSFQRKPWARFDMEVIVWLARNP